MIYKINNYDYVVAEDPIDAINIFNNYWKDVPSVSNYKITNLELISDRVLLKENFKNYEE